MRRLASLLAAMLALTASAARAGDRPPITVTLAWVGTPCNEGGLVDVTVTNVSDREIVMPEAWQVGQGGMFIAAAQVNEGEIVLSDNMAIPPPPRPGEPAVDAPPVRRLAPGQAATWRRQLDESSDGQMEGSPHFAFDTAYRQMRRSSGKLWLGYALSSAPDPAKPYVLDSGEGPMITSNAVSCPG